MDNVVSMFDGPDTPKAEPDYMYTITLKDGSTTEQRGYLVVNSLFAAIARGEGIIYWMQPFETVLNITNQGPVGTMN